MEFELKALDGELSEVLAKVVRSKPLVLVREEEKKSQLWLEQDFLYIDELGLRIYAGIHCCYFEQIKDFEVNSCVYVFYSEAGDEVYSETDSTLSACLVNYCRMAGIEKTVDEIKDMVCTFNFDKGRFLKENVIDRIPFELEGNVDIKDLFR